MAAITVTVPLPHPWLSPNRRTHWAPKATAVKKAREAAFLCAKEALARNLPPRWAYATLSVAWYSLKRQPDADNVLAMLKPSIDGLEDAGIFENDRGLKITGVEVLKQGHECVELCVTRAE